MVNSPWFVLLLGMGTVFFGLVCLIVLTKLMGLLLGVKRAAPEPAPEVQAQAPAPLAEPIADRKKFDAVVAATIAAYLGTDISGLRILSVKRIGQAGTASNGIAPGERAPLVAAISAAIATIAGDGVKGLRIHSIKKI